MSEITPVIVPKWGLTMAEGTIVGWHKAEGDAVSDQEDLVDIETAKITNVGPSPAGGILRRILVGEGETKLVGALIGVIAEKAVADSEIDAFIAGFSEQSTESVDGAAQGGGLSRTTIETSLGPVSVGLFGSEDAPALVLIHGFGSDMDGWSLNIEALANNRRIVAFDLPGHGSSTKNVGDGTIQSLAAALLEVLRALDLNTVDLVGHSLGGAIALKLAPLLGERLCKVVLISPAGLGSGEVSASFLNELITARRKRELRTCLEMLVNDPSRISDEFVESLIRFRRLDGVIAGLGLLRDRMVEGSQFAQLDDLARRCDALCITGDSDRIVSTDFTGLRAERILECGHMPHIEKPDEVNALIAAELN